MFQQVVTQGQVQPFQVTAQSFTTVMSIIMAVWAGTWVLSQVIKVVKGEEIEKPPIIKY